MITPARGTKLTAQQISQGLAGLAATATNLPNPETGSLSLNFSATLQSTLSVDPESPGWVVGFRIPAYPFLPTSSPATIHTESLSIGWDDAMSGLGVTDEYSSIIAGYLCAPDMSRYTMEVRLCGRPSQQGGVLTEFFRTELPGVETFSGPGRQNPLTIPLSVEISPQLTYYLFVRVPGLWNQANPNTENLMLPNLNLTIRCRTPVVGLDPQDILCQNAPIFWNPVPTTTPIGTFAPNDPVDATLIQQSIRSIERRQLTEATPYPSRELGAAGGLDPDGQVDPQQSMYRSGWVRSVLNIPLYQEWDSIRSSTVTDDIPYAGNVPPYLLPIGTRAVIPVPQNFVLTQVLCYISVLSPTAPLQQPTYVGWGVTPTGPDFTTQIGVSLLAAGADQTEQQVAYLDFNPTTRANYVVDRLSQNARDVGWLLEVPLVGDALYPSLSPNGTGLPVYMGLTAQPVARTPISPLPASPTQPPLTNGRESHLIVRVVMQDSADGLGDPARPDDVRIGIGGVVVQLIGYRALAGASEPPATLGTRRF